MHEFSICQALLKQVRELAHTHRAQAVRSITLQIGPLSGIEPQLLAEAFEMARIGSCAQDAQLHVEPLPVRVHCTDCGSESAATPNRLLCGACGSYRTQLSSGDELLLSRVELETAPRAPLAAAAADCTDTEATG